MEDVSVKLQIDGANITTHPVFGDDIKLKITTETDQIFHRQSIGGTFKFLGEDFDIIEKCSDNIIFTISVYRGESIVGSATFVKADCEFNYDDKVCSVKLTTTDRYETLLGNLDNKYNLVKLAPEIKSLHLTLRPIIQLYARGDNKITNIYGGMYFEQDCTMVSEHSELINTYHFLDVAPLACVYVSEVHNDAPSAIIGAYYMQNSNTSTTIIYKHKTANYYIQETVVDTFNFVLYDGNDQIICSAQLPSWDNPGTYLLNFTNYEGGQNINKAFGTFAKDGELYCRVLCPKTDGSSSIYERPTSDITEKNSNYPYVAQIYGDIIVQRLTAVGESTTTPTEWGMNYFGKYFQEPVLTSSQQSAGINVIPIAQSFWYMMSTWLLLDNTIYHSFDYLSLQYTLKDTYPLWSAIKVLLNKIDSTILWDDSFACSDILHIPINNTDTGLSGAIGLPNSRFSSLYITPITNVKKTQYDQPAQRGDMTLKQIFDMLRNVYNLYWWIDDNNRLRIEHISYFNQGDTYAMGEPVPNLDITTMDDYPNREKWSLGTSSITHDRTKCTSRTEFEWGNDCTYPFIGEPIDIKDKYADLTKKDKISVDNFISDIDYTVITPDLVDDDLYALIEADYNKKVAIAKIRLSGSSPIYEVQNGYCSFLYLERNALAYDRGGWWAYAGDAFIGAANVKKFIKQSINFPVTISQIGNLNLIKTGVGNGFVDEAEIDLNTLFAKAKISTERARDNSLYLTIGTYQISVGQTGHSITNITHYPLVVNFIITDDATNMITHEIEVVIYPLETYKTGYNVNGTHLRILSAVFGGPYIISPMAQLIGGKMSMSVDASLPLEYYPISINGNNYIDSVDWGYFQIEAIVDLIVTLTASSASADYGWINSTPCVEPQSLEDIPSSQKVSGTGSISYNVAAGTKVYVGYTKDYTAVANDDKISILIVES